MKKFFITAMALSCTIALAQHQGKVGINIDSPNATFNVKSQTGTDGTTANFQLQNANNDVLMKVLDNGRVGIKTNNPEFSLDVRGFGKFYVPNSSSILFLQADQGHFSNITYRRENKSRWIAAMTNAEETGDNAGSDYVISSYKDDGTFMSTPVTILRQNGFVGINNQNPKATLDIGGNIKIADGTQGAGKILMSNADGVAHWDVPAVTYRNYIGVFPDNLAYYPSTEVSTEEERYSRTSFSFTLDPGKYQIFVNGLAPLGPNTETAPPTEGYRTDWRDNKLQDQDDTVEIRLGFANSTEDYLPSTVHGSLSGLVGAMGISNITYPLIRNQVSYTTFIQNNTSSPQTYYLYVRAVKPLGSTIEHTVYDLFNGRWLEDSITAVRIGD